MATITLRDVPEDLRALLARRAAEQSISLNDYLLQICEAAAEEGWIDLGAIGRLEGLPPYPTARIITPWTDPDDA